MTAAVPRKKRASVAWYVDNSLGTGTNAGTSWANAWRTIAAVSWTSLGPGDVLYISGGATSQTYNEIMTIGAHTATAARPLTITKAPHAGKNGTVILDGATTQTSFAGSVIDTNAKTNMIIQNLTVQNCYERCVYVNGTASGTVVIQNLTVHTGTGIFTAVTNATTVTGSTPTVLHFAAVPAFVITNTSVQDATASGAIPQQSWVVSQTGTTVTMNNAVVSTVGSGDTINFGYNARGIQISGYGGVVIVQNCTVDTPVTIAQTDGIYTLGNTGPAGSVIIQNNTITNNNIDPDGHNDGFQSFQDANVTIRGNTVLYPSGGLGNNHCMIITDPAAGGVVNYYNNVFYMGPKAVAAGIGSDPGTGALFQQLGTTLQATVTVTSATPAVVTWTASNFAAGYPVAFTTTGTLPVGITAGQTYYVIATGLTANSFQFSATPGGTAINTTSTGTGTLTGNAGWMGTINFYNNTVVGGSPGIMYIFPGSGPYMTVNTKNNIFLGNPIDSTPFWLVNGAIPTPANHANNLVFTDNSSLTRVSCTTNASTGGARGTVSQSTGLRYFEIQQGYNYSGGHTLFGISNATNNLAVYLGSTTNGCGYEWDTGQLYIGGAVITTVQLAAPGDVVAVAVDFTHSKIWVKNLNTTIGWNNAAIGSQDPANNLGGSSLATLAAGPYFITQTINGMGSYSVINTGATAFAGTIPVGFSAWGGTWNAADTLAPATMTAPIAMNNTTPTDWATWQTAGYDAGGVNADPLLVGVTTDFHIVTSSPAKNAGATLASVIQDRDGFARPRGGAYDIGAYEF